MARMLGARRLLPAITMVVAVAVGAAAAIPVIALGDDQGATLKVMTRNMDTGTDFGYLLSATTSAEVVAGATNTYLEVLASNPVGRADGIAREIQATRPDVVALQEVTLWMVGPPCSPHATTVSIDQLAALQAALLARGQHYTAEVIADNQAAEAPTLIPPNPSVDTCPPGVNLGITVGFLDRDVLLVRNRRGLDVSNPQTAHFVNALTLPPSLGGGPLLRSWESVDIRVGGRAARVIGTHLEAFDPVAQVGQAHEIAVGPAATRLPVILAGDMNTGPGGELDGYRQLLSDHFVDAWPDTGNGPGLTNPLHNEDPLPPGTPIHDTAPTQRIDMVLTRHGAEAEQSQLTGNTTAAKIPTGQWPSDHAGVVSQVGVDAGAQN